MTKKHKCFVGSACIDGRCPRALANEHNMRDDDALMLYEGLEKLSCKRCGYFEYECDNCIFKDTEMCEESSAK